MLPKGWRKKTLGEVSQFLDGLRKPVKESERAIMRGIYPYYGASGIIDYVNDYLIDDDVVLLGEDGENILSRQVPLAFRVTGKVWVNNHAHVIKPHSSMDIGFLTNYLESLSYEKFNTGTAQPKLNKQVCLSIPVVVPPLPEQQKIAAILSTWDRVIELTESMIAAKQKRKQAIMQQLFTGKLRLPGFKKSVWKKCHLHDVAKNSTRRNGVPSNDRTVYSVTNSVGMVPMDEGIIGESIDRYKTVSRFDFAYNPMRINVGSIAMWDGNEDVLVSPDYVVFRCGSKLDAHFLNHFRRMHYWRHFVNRAGGGSVRVRIYFSDLGSIKLILPSIQEQKGIANVLNAQDSEIGLHRRRLNALKRQKRGLIQQLLTGKVRVNLDAKIEKV